jgi:hypothetical protein
MIFALVFMTAGMASSPANIGDVPAVEQFAALPACEQARDQETTMARDHRLAVRAGIIERTTISASVAAKTCQKMATSYMDSIKPNMRTFAICIHW